MADRARAGRGVDDRDVVRKSAAARRTMAAERAASEATERMGRDQQRRATAYGRARGRL